MLAAATTDTIKIENEELAISLIALHQPEASNLRALTMMIKLNNDLERIADHAVNIAHSAEFLMDRPEVKPLIDLPRMSEDTVKMLKDALDASATTILKDNISWHLMYPSSNTTPWQLEGVIRALAADGYSRDLIHACHNRTVVIDAHLGERENKQLGVVEAHGLRNVHLYEGEEWVHIRDAVGDLADEFLCLNEVYPKGFHIPKRFLGENIIHLPTVKTHVFATTLAEHNRNVYRWQKLYWQQRWAEEKREGSQARDP